MCIVSTWMNVVEVFYPVRYWMMNDPVVFTGCTNKPIFGRPIFLAHHTYSKIDIESRKNSLMSFQK